MKSEPKVGMEFVGCSGRKPLKFCAQCSDEQRERCELLARSDHQYSDDPRTAEFDKR